MGLLKFLFGGTDNDDATSECAQVRCEDLVPGDVIRGGYKRYIVASTVEADGQDQLIIHFVGTEETLTTTPDALAWVENKGLLFDLDDPPKNAPEPGMFD